MRSGSFFSVVVAVLLGSAFLMSGRLLTAVETVVRKQPALSSIPVREEAPHTPELLVFVIAGGIKPPYEVLRTYWREIAHRVRPLGIHVYMISFDPTLNRTRWDKRSSSLTFPGEDSLVPGTLNETFLAMRTVHEQKLPGYDAKVVYRTNLSTFTRFDALLEYMARVDPKKPYYGGFLYEYTNFPKFIGGFGIIWNRLAYDLLRQSEARLRWDKIDDVGIGHIFEELKVKPTHIPSCWLEHLTDLDRKSYKFHTCTESMFQFRIKFAVAKDPYLDVSVWNFLYQKYYSGLYGRTLAYEEFDVPVIGKRAPKKKRKKTAK